MTRWYCTLDALKIELGITDTAQDARLSRVIPRATAAIETVTGRMFVPEYASKKFDIPRDRMRLWLEYDDLLNVSTLSDFAGVIANDKFYLLPANHYPKHTILLDWDKLGRWFEYDDNPREAITLAGLWGYCQDTEVVGTLGAAITTTTQTSVTVTSAAEIEVGWCLLVGTEQMFVTAADGATVTVKRGNNGTTAATHLIGATVSRYVVPADIEQACIGMIAHAMTQAQRSGISSMSIGEYSITFDRASIPATILTTLRRYARS